MKVPMFPGLKDSDRILKDLLEENHYMRRKLRLFSTYMNDIDKVGVVVIPSLQVLNDEIKLFLNKED